MIGFITSIPMAVPVMNRMDIFIGTFVMGMIYGLLTELITTKLLRLKRHLHKKFVLKSSDISGDYFYTI